MICFIAHSRVLEGRSFSKLTGCSGAPNFQCQLQISQASGGGPPKAVASIGSVLLGGTAVVYAGYSSLFTVEGGHRAVMFNRLGGVSEQVRRMFPLFMRVCS